VHLPGGTEKNHEGRVSIAGLRPKFEPGTSQMRRRNADWSTATFSTKVVRNTACFVCHCSVRFMIIYACSEQVTAGISGMVLH
jgi:hypothetical protein